MTWIETTPPSEADPHLARCYEEVYRLYPPEYRAEVPAVQGADGRADSITSAHSLLPEVMKHTFSTFGLLLSPDLPLTRRQHEMIATVVSALNRCFYELESHAEFLRLVTLDEGLTAALRRDYREADLCPADRAMLDYVAKLHAAPARMTRADVDALRAAGFDDVGVLQINLIASWFEYVNRVADGLGVGRP